MNRMSWLIGGLLSGVVCAANAQAASATRQTPSAESSARPDLASPLDRHVTLDLQNVTIAAALDEIARQAHLDLSFNDEVVPSSRKVTIKVTNVTAREALKRVLRGTGTIVHESPNGSVMLAKDGKTAEKAAPNTISAHGTGRVWGKVTDSASTQLIGGAVVSIDASSVTATTNDSGFFLIQAPEGIHTLVVRHLGYSPIERPVVVPDSGFVRMDVAMHMGMTRMQEVVTTATGPQRRYELANDITILDADSLTRTQPISSVTQLLEGRVPGLTVEHTSGAPGDPSRLRLRGTSSMLKNNDPIVIVDGVRVHYSQSDSTSANLASGRNSAGTFVGQPTGAPSPLDQIDPQAIQTIEVLKGPSAATLYGPDAANGVIVITMKKGQSGPARWSMSATHGLSYMPGNYPDGLYRWGTDLTTQLLVLCPLQSFSCRADSVVSFQALNDPKYTVLHQGNNSSLQLGVSGGSEALTYAVSGSYDNEEGILGLPEVEAQQFEAEHGTAPDSWMTRPQQLERWTASSRLTAKLGSKADASVTTMLTREKQQRSDLENDLSGLMSTYINAGTYWQAFSTSIATTNVLLPDFYQKTTDDATNFTNAATINWRPLGWLTTSADVGINVINRQDNVLLPPGLLLGTLLPQDSAGSLHAASGNILVSTVNLRATGTLPMPWGFHLQLSTGANYTRTSETDAGLGVSGLAPGTTSVNGAQQITFASQAITDITSFGWYLEPDFVHDRFTISTGFRVDGSSTFGSNVSVPIFPKVGVSWLLSQEPWFPMKHFFDVLRVRAAYGRAGVWPGPTEKLRLYASSNPWEGSSFVDATQVSTIGNTQLRPERSDETEGGFDADFLDSRLSIGFSGYRKMRYDAIEGVPVAPSIYGLGVTQYENIGTVRNTGIEASLTAQLVRTDPVTWTASVNVTRNHNLVTSLGPGVLPFGPDYARVVAGYPLFGRWARPILGYSDIDGNGIITRNEVQLGDSLVFMGGSDPNYEANLFSTLSLLRGRITVSGSLAYQAGLTQINQTVGSSSAVLFLAGASNPHAPLAEQAAVAVMNETPYGMMQTVNTLRFNSFSLAYNFSTNAAAHIGARSLSVALQGTNLGLFTNYKGKDPNVNAYSTGNNTIDTGVLPQPRAWSLAVHATY